MSSKNARDGLGSAPTGRPWSLATRLTAWYAGSAFLLVLAVTAYLYWAMLSTVDREDDALLADKVRVVRAVLLQRPGDTAAIRQAVEDTWDARQNEKTYVRILDGDGRVLVESPGLERTLPPTLFPRPSGELGRGTDVPAEGGRVYRVVAVREPGSPLTVQVAMDRGLEVEILGDYLKHLGYASGVALVACAIVGYLIAHRGVRPLHDITQTAQRIRPTNLGERMAPDGLPAELLALAATFNGMLDRLEQAFTRLSRFSADIAHELRTPVHALRGEVEVALSKPRSPDEYREVLLSSLEECGRLAHIIDRLLFLARAEHPETQVAKEPCELGEELAAVCEFYEPAATEAGVKLDVVMDKPLPADLDRPLFQRAVGNLVANAIAHTPPGGRVILTAEAVGPAVAVRVSDTGRGIPAAHLPHVFDRFYRVDRSRSSRRGGVGLGLAIVRTIVELHGGAVQLDSEVGRGTCVTLSFPRISERTPARNQDEIQRNEITES
jgi:two-component system heavy metal sensor histidine kinase CusS